MTKNETTNQPNKSKVTIIVLSVMIVLLGGYIALTMQPKTTTLSKTTIPEERLALVQELKTDYNNAYKGMVRYLGDNETGELDPTIELISINPISDVSFVQIYGTLETTDGTMINVPSFYSDGSEQAWDYYLSENYGIELSNLSMMESIPVGEVVNVSYIDVNGMQNIYIFPASNVGPAFIRDYDLNNAGMDIEF